MSSPFPRRSRPRPSSDLAAHFGGGIRHYLEPLESTVKKVYFSSLPPFSLLVGRCGRFDGKKEVDFTLRIVHDSFPRGLLGRAQMGPRFPVIDRVLLLRGAFGSRQRIVEMLSPCWEERLIGFCIINLDSSVKWSEPQNLSHSSVTNYGWHVLSLSSRQSTLSHTR